MRDSPRPGRTARSCASTWADSDGLVFEGSANLRTNKNREQLTAIRDRKLHDWHAAWIDELVRADDGKEAETEV